jgi:hypothetical protein
MAAIMPATEEMPKHHAGHGEQQSNHQADSVNNHKSSLIECWNE